jgi:fibronectin-binding autotransporter adhesin
MKFFSPKAIFISLLATFFTGTVIAQTLTITGTQTYNAPVSTLPVGPNNPTMWLDAADLSNFTLTGNHVGTWADETVNGRSVSRTDARANQPTIGINPVTGLASVVFDGRDVLANTYNVGGVYTIVTASSLTGSQNARLIAGTSNNWLLGYHGGGQNKFHPNVWVSNPAISFNTNMHFYGATGNGTTNATFFDGNTTIVPSFASGSLQGPNGVSLGAWNNNPGSEPTRGYVSELLIFDRVLNSTELTDINNYLQAKWTPGGQIADNTEVVVNAGNTLALNNTAETVGTLTGNGSVTLTNAVLGTGANNASTAFSGTISGTGGVTKLGTGTQTLSGANTYTGGTQVHQGTLDLGASGNVGSANSIVNVGSHLGTSTLTIGGGSLQASSITVGGDGAGVMNVNGGTVTANVDTGFGTLVAGLYNSGTINQSAGTVTVQGGGYGILGRYGSATGTYNLSGGVFQTTGTSEVFLGWDSAGASGILEVSGTGQFLVGGNLRAANQGSVSLSQTGGTITVGGVTNLANENSATGDAALGISGGTFTTNGVNMARNNAGALATLNISGGNLISTANFEATPRGTATISQTGGLLDVRNAYFILGRYTTGTATMSIDNAITQTSGTSGNRRFHMAWDQAGAQATLTLKGTGQIIVNKDNVATGSATGFLAGEQGNANILIQDNAKLTVYGQADAEGAMSLGRNGAATVTVTQTGGQVELHNNYFIMGRNGTSAGTYNISAGTLETAGTFGNRRFHLGWDSTTASGTLHLSGTSEVTLNRDNANAVPNPGSGLQVGNHGTGTVTVANNAKLTVYGIDDADAALFVGLNNGTSTFTQSGGEVNIFDGRIRAGANNASHGTITVNGGTFTHGLSGAHALSALPNDMHTYLGWDAAASTGIINVGGTGVMTLGANVHAGGNGTAQINVSGNGHLTVDGSVNLAQNASSNGSLSITGNGLLTTKGLAAGRGTATATINGGTLQAGGEFRSNQAITVGSSGAKFDSNGTRMTLAGALTGPGGITKKGSGTVVLSGSNSYAGATTIEAGTLALETTTPTLEYRFDGINSAKRITNFGSAGGWHDGILQASATLTSTTAGRSGEALSIDDNSNQWMQTGNYGAPTGSDYTISAWFRQLHPTGAWRTLTRGSGADHHIIVQDTSDNLGLYKGGFDDSGYDLTAGNASWKHVAAVSSGTTTMFYIDGVFVGTALDKTTADIWAIGNYQSGGQPFSQHLDDFQLFQKALTAADISNLFAGTPLNGTLTNVVPDTSRVNLAGGASLDLFGNSETIGSLNDFSGNGGVVTSNHPSNAILTLGADNTTDANFSGIIQDGIGGTLDLVKTGTGTQTLSGANTYTGNTTISGGTLALSGNGSIDNSPEINIASGATFDVTGRTGGSYTYSGKILGNGSTQGQINVGLGGRVAPGNSLGTLTVVGGPLTLLSGSTLEMELANPLVQGITPLGPLLINDGQVNYAALIGGTPAPQPPALGATNDVVVGDVTFTTGSTLEVLPVTGPLSPTGLFTGLAWKLIVGDIIGNFDIDVGLGTDYTLNGGNWATTQGGINLKLPDLWFGQSSGYYNWDLSLFQSHGIIIVVPEPSRALLVLLALLPVCLRRRRSPR